ncbi:MAG TPA: hypothetical protein VEQ85_00525 [Lacipirellulaceae bacterium]|nr:hypothetical protein [Lacipirellulaceae bacterium]
MVRPDAHHPWFTPLPWLALALMVCGCGPAGQPSAEGEAVQVGPRQIVALGRLEPAGGVLEISALPGDVLKRYGEGVQEGSTVAPGAELAIVGSYDLRSTQLDAINAKLELGRQQREQELALAKANYQQALAAKAEVDAKLEEINAQGEALASLAEAAQLGMDDYRELARLQQSDPELVNSRQLQRRGNQAEQAAREYEVRRRTHEAAKRAAIAAVSAAAENAHVAELNLRLSTEIDRNRVTEFEKKVAEETLEQSVLRAPPAEGDQPIRYTVLKTFMKPGEIVSQLPVVQIGDLSSMVCIAEVYEADVKEIEVGQKATIRSPAFSAAFADGDANGNGAGGLHGKVVRVGSVVSSAGLIQRNPLAPSDRSIVEVLIAITGDDAASTAKATAEAAGHIGLQVTVQFGEKAAVASPPGPAQPAPSGAAPAPPTSAR